MILSISLQLFSDLNSFITLIALVVGAIAMLSAIEVVPEYERRAVLLFGEYRKMLDPGIHVVPPFVSRTVAIDVRAQVWETTVDGVVARDRTPVSADLVVQFRVSDPEVAFLADDPYPEWLSDRSRTALREELERLDPDQIVRSLDDVAAAVDRALINADSFGLEIEDITVADFRGDNGNEMMG